MHSDLEEGEIVDDEQESTDLVCDEPPLDTKDKKINKVQHFQDKEAVDEQSKPSDLPGQMVEIVAYSDFRYSKATGSSKWQLDKSWRRKPYIHFEDLTSDDPDSKISPGCHVDAERFDKSKVNKFITSSDKIAATDEVYQLTSSSECGDGSRATKTPFTELWMQSSQSHQNRRSKSDYKSRSLRSQKHRSVRTSKNSPKKSSKVSHRRKPLASISSTKVPLLYRLDVMKDVAADLKDEPPNIQRENTIGDSKIKPGSIGEMLQKKLKSNLYFKKKNLSEDKNTPSLDNTVPPLMLPSSPAEPIEVIVDLAEEEEDELTLRYRALQSVNMPKTAKDLNTQKPEDSEQVSITQAKVGFNNLIFPPKEQIKSFARLPPEDNVDNCIPSITKHGFSDIMFPPESELKSLYSFQKMLHECKKLNNIDQVNMGENTRSEQQHNSDETVDMDICSSDEEIEAPIMQSTENIHKQNLHSPTIPVEWAYMVPPPASEPTNSFSNVNRFCYDQNMCVQAMETTFKDTSTQEEHFPDFNLNSKAPQPYELTSSNFDKFVPGANSQLENSSDAVTDFSFQRSTPHPSNLEHSCSLTGGHAEQYKAFMTNILDQSTNSFDTTDNYRNLVNVMIDNSSIETNIVKSSKKLKRSAVNQNLIEVPIYRLNQAENPSNTKKLFKAKKDKTKNVEEFPEDSECIEDIDTTIKLEPSLDEDIDNPLKSEASLDEDEDFLLAQLLIDQEKRAQNVQTQKVNLRDYELVNKASYSRTNNKRPSAKSYKKDNSIQNQKLGIAFSGSGISRKKRDKPGRSKSPPFKFPLIKPVIINLQSDTSSDEQEGDGQPTESITTIPAINQFIRSIRQSETAINMDSNISPPKLNTPKALHYLSRSQQENYKKLQEQLRHKRKQLLQNKTIKDKCAWDSPQLNIEDDSDVIVESPDLSSQDESQSTESDKIDIPVQDFIQKETTYSLCESSPVHVSSTNEDEELELRNLLLKSIGTNIPKKSCTTNIMLQPLAKVDAMSNQNIQAYFPIELPSSNVIEPNNLISTETLLELKSNVEKISITKEPLQTGSDYTISLKKPLIPSPIPKDPIEERLTIEKEIENTEEEVNDQMTIMKSHSDEHRNSTTYLKEHARSDLVSKSCIKKLATVTHEVITIRDEVQSDQQKFITPTVIEPATTKDDATSENMQKCAVETYQTKKQLEADRKSSLLGRIEEEYRTQRTLVSSTRFELFMKVQGGEKDLQEHQMLTLLIAKLKLRLSQAQDKLTANTVKVRKNVYKIHDCKLTLIEDTKQMDRLQKLGEKLGKKVCDQTYKITQDNNVEEHNENAALFSKIIRLSHKAGPLLSPKSSSNKDFFVTSHQLKRKHMDIGLAKSTQCKRRRYSFSREKQTKLTRKVFKLDNRLANMRKENIPNGNTTCGSSPKPKTLPHTSSSTNKLLLAQQNELRDPTLSKDRMNAKVCDVLCPHDLLGRCNDDNCSYRHLTNSDHEKEILFQAELTSNNIVDVVSCPSGKGTVSSEGTSAQNIETVNKTDCIVSDQSRDTDTGILPNIDLTCVKVELNENSTSEDVDLSIGEKCVSRCIEYNPITVDVDSCQDENLIQLDPIAIEVENRVEVNPPETNTAMLQLNAAVRQTNVSPLLFPFDNSSAIKCDNNLLEMGVDKEAPLEMETQEFAKAVKIELPEEDNIDPNCSLGSLESSDVKISISQLKQLKPLVIDLERLSPVTLNMYSSGQEAALDDVLIQSSSSDTGKKRRSRKSSREGGCVRTGLRLRSHH